MPRLNTRQKPRIRHKTKKNKWGYGSLSLRGDSVDHLKDAFKKFQGLSLEKLTFGNPLFSDFTDLLLTLYDTPADKLPRLLYVSKGPTRTTQIRVVLYDTVLRMPVVSELDSKGVWHTYTRDPEMKAMYEEYAKKASRS